MKISIERLTELSYQGAHTMIKKMNEEDATEAYKALQGSIASMYEKCSHYGEIEYGTINNGKNDTHVYVKNMTVSDAEYQRTMSKLKKFEIIFGYLFDRVCMTNYMEVR